MLTEPHTTAYSPPRKRLTAYPDWRYLLDEFDAIYRAGSNGGSAKIRGHRKRVRDRLSAIMDANPDLGEFGEATLPVIAHLGRALDHGAYGPLGALCRALARVSGQLKWEHGYERMPKSLRDRYGYAEILGPRGPIFADSLILGFVLFAPSTTYPQHSHSSIEESYVSVSGAWSENDVAVYAPGSLILNLPGVEHRITTGQDNPCLLAYAWVGPPERLIAPDMRFTPSRRTGRG